MPANLPLQVNQTKLTDALTVEQQAVVAHKSGHAKVIAVAGAGKTTTLVHFILNRLVSGASARRMLVLMYNKAAQQDFVAKLERTSSSYHPDTDNVRRIALPEVRTFHSLGLKIYRRLIADGHLASFDQKLLSDAEMESLCWRLLQDSAKKQGDHDKAQEILDQKSKWVEPALSFFELVKSTLRSPEEVFEESGLPARCRFFIDTFARFESWRKTNRKISFSDMLYDPCQFFSKQPKVAQSFAGHMHQIIVDEYQDINEIQQFLLKTLHGGKGDLMVVGDPDQTIYEFRGSRPEFMATGFDNDFAGVAVYNLTNTFRFGHRLSLLCNHLISCNPDRDELLCVSHKATPNTRIFQLTAKKGMSKPEPGKTNDDSLYAATVIQQIKQLNEIHPLSNIAVLNRIWAIAAPIELALLAEQIPYHLDNDYSVLDRSELMPFKAIFALASGEFSTISFEQRKKYLVSLLTQPYPKIRRVQLDQLANDSAAYDCEVGRAIRRHLPETLSARQSDSVLVRTRLLDKVEKQEIDAAKSIAQYINKTDFEEGMRESSFSAQQVDDRLATVRAFQQYFVRHPMSCGDAWRHLQSLELQRQNMKSNKTAPAVRLTSMHKAKGLEWPIVIIPGLSRKFMPYQPEGELTIPSSIESERRLLYVAITRAKQALYLISPESRAITSDLLSEMAFDQSDLVGAAIEKHADNISVSSVQSVTKDLKVSQAYLDINKVSLVLQPMTEKENNKHMTSVLKENQSTSLPRVFHQVYGEGHLLKEESRTWFIKFDTGITKQFDKTMAAQYLEFI